MKIRPNRKNDGSAVIVVMAILALMLLLSTANRRILNTLHGEVQLLEQQQIKKLERFQPRTAGMHPASTTPALSAWAAEPQRAAVPLAGRSDSFSPK